MKLLSDTDLAARLGWTEVLGALEAAFRRRAEEPRAFELPERLALAGPGGGAFLIMPCADEGGWFGVKQVSVLPGNAGLGLPTVQAWYTLMDPSGSPVLACSATLLTKIRTAAASALAARSLAPSGAARLLVVGTGSLAPWLAEAHLQVRPYREITVWGRNPDKAWRTAEELNERLGDRAEVRAVEVLEPALGAADVITVATTATEPMIRGAGLRAGQHAMGQRAMGQHAMGQHLDLVGAFKPDMREADAQAVLRASVFVDDLAAAQAEAGDLIQAAAEGWSFGRVQGDLAAVVSGAAGRKGEDELTLFKSVGLAVEDLVVARLLV